MVSSLFEPMKFCYNVLSYFQGGATLLLQLAPILLLVVLSLVSSFFVSDPVFSLQRSE